MRYFLSFVEEAIMNPQYEGYVAGRLEIYDDDAGPYSLREVRFFTKNREGFYKFRSKWDFKIVTKRRLLRIEADIKLRFCEP